MDSGLELSHLECLPAELLFQILTFLPAESLCQVLSTSKRMHAHACNDMLWEILVRQYVPPETPLSSPTPAPTWRQLYVCHHPYWFLVQHKLWHADTEFSGDAVLVRYVPEEGCILAHKILAKNTLRTAHQWMEDSSAFIMHFRPEIRLWEDEPVLRLEYHDDPHSAGSQAELQTSTGGNGVRSSLSLCRSVPNNLQYESMSLWPPSTIPSRQRVRNQSPSLFRSDRQPPLSRSDASDTSFRLRKWPEMSSWLQSVSSRRLGEQLSTWNAVLSEFITPPSDRPFQGIWVGDYSTHGCELLLVIQQHGKRRTRQMTVAAATRSGLPQGFTLDSEDENDESYLRPEQDASERDQQDAHAANAEDFTCLGSLQAVKLTGDVNIPRGEITWFADDISNQALIRIAGNDPYKGCRIVKSLGHVAERGFQDDRFINSQLILQDRDQISQYWEDFGHISNYKRVDINALLRHEISCSIR